MTNNIRENYWFHDFNELFDFDKYITIRPQSYDNYIKKVNMSVRLSILIGITLTIININLNYLVIPFIVMSFSYLIYKKKSEEYKFMDKQAKETFDKLNNLDNRDSVQNIASHDLMVNENFFNIKQLGNVNKYINNNKCQYPTKDNIFMNVLPYDDRKRYEACDVLDKDIKNIIDNNFMDYPKDTSELFNKSNPRLIFHSTASTTIPNKQNEFASWVYGRNITCKEGNGKQCYNNIYSGLETRLGGYDF